MKHSVLLGDSIFDNAAYVADGSPLVEQLRLRLPRDWRVTLLARDGAAAADIDSQLENVPDDATHLVVSVGGNDALESASLKPPAASSTEMLDDLVRVQTRFQHEYRRTVREIGW